jgi:hypothetical protein
VETKDEGLEEKPVERKHKKTIFQSMFDYSLILP